jgi:V8-like Glu-specific endopeptidase
MASSNEYREKIAGQLKTYDYKAVEKTCSDLVKDLYCSDIKFETSDAEKIMQQLRNKRLFHLMQNVGNALIQTGKLTYKIRRQYAQALIDQNNFTAALAILKELVSDTSNAPGDDDVAGFENTEARGLTGRVYKQLYVNAECPKAGYSSNFLKEAIKFYLDVYINEPTERTWHGINAVALLKRAAADNIELAGFADADELAKAILKTIENKNENQKADAWEFATAAEACVALNKPTEALEWISGYARMPYCDAFELASTLRQMEQIWKLDMNSETGRLLLPVLRAELLKRDGGTVIIKANELKEQQAIEDDISARYKTLIEPQKTSKTIVVLEKVFGDDSFKTYKWYMTGANRCLAVARIGRDSSKGFGTGFLLKGNTLHESLGEELVLITNAHVVSNDPVEKALDPQEAIVIFEALNRDEEFKFDEIIWSSPSDKLDATVLSFSKEDQKRLKALTKEVKLYPVSKYLPATDPDNSQRIYVIGHPFGGTLQLSFQDNILLDHEDPRIHYRTPTEGGSSGSPVFNQQWDLIGLHHAGSEEMPCLNGKAGMYEANEGMWIQAIKKSLSSQFS